MNIRPETSDDIATVRDILRAAFSGDQEADLVDALRHDGDLLLSLVAEEAGRIIGHVGFSRLWIRQAEQRMPAVSLAPLSVVVGCRRRGVGAALVEKGHARLRTAGESIAFVLGDPTYYGRFGYSTAAAAPFDCAYAGQYFQALPLAGPVPTAGAIIYANAFGGLQ